MRPSQKTKGWGYSSVEYLLCMCSKKYWSKKNSVRVNGEGEGGQIWWMYSECTYKIEQ
jgi:hypothetical protein